MSFQTSRVRFKETSIFVRVSIWKIRAASREQLLGYHGVSAYASPLDLLTRYKSIRQVHIRFFSLQQDPVSWMPQSLTQVIQRVLTILCIAPPSNGNFTSHILRIGAHTDQLLIFIPLEERILMFGLGHDSNSMPKFYFDRTIRLTNSSYWFFGAPVPPSIIGSSNASSQLHEA